MPTYEYECQTCGLRFEKFQNMKDRPLKTCPECSGPVRRLIGTGAAIITKGPGPSRGAPGRFETACSRERPCCGRDTPSDVRPCDE